MPSHLNLPTRRLRYSAFLLGKNLAGTRVANPIYLPLSVHPDEVEECRVAREGGKEESRRFLR
eukprot:scaffold4055_cov80-Skeletonema_menzelii.AAC.1